MERPRLVLLATSLAAFTATLDNTVVAVALRDVQADLGSSVLGLQGIVTAYTVALAALLLPGGGLVDRLGARRVLSLGVLLFATASALCASAHSVTALVVWRAVQGLGAALLLPGGLAVLAAAYPDPVRRRRAIGVWAAVSGGALVAGPVVGGELVSRHGWPAVFWVNVPLSALVLLLLTGHQRNARTREDSGGLDVPGAALSCLVLAAGTYAVVLAGRDGLSWRVGLAAAVAATAALALRAVERRTTEPLLPARLLQDRGFRGATVAAFAAALAVFVLMVFVSLFLQVVLDHDARHAGAVLLALPLALVATAALTSRWHAVVLPVLLGLVLAGVGLLGLGLVLDAGTADSAIKVWLALIGAGVGLTTAPVVTVTLAAAGARRAGLASASVTVARELGGVVAVAGLGALAVSRLTARLTDTMIGAGVPAGARPAMLDALLRADKATVRRQLLDAVGVDRALGAYGTFQAAATESFVTSTRWVLTSAGGVLLALALTSTVLLRSEHLRERVEEG